MKTFFLLLSIFCLAVTQLNAQAPEGINYQAVIRNASGTLVANSTVAIRIQLRQGSATGSIVYQERHSTTTTAQGLVNLVIGNGTVQSGSFGVINWGSGPYFVNLAVDFSNGTNYQDFGTQQLMSVPFALYAKTAGNQLNQWRYGNGAPATSLGAFGDFYLDVQNGNVYYKNTGSSWVLTGNITGPQGATGATGPAGTQGPQGATGTQGLTGPAGPQGPQGPQGIQGATGATGATGLQGPAGVVGPQGPAGTNGNTILNGTSNPTAGTGVNGDYYMNTATNTFFGPKANGTWPAGFSMVGPQGAQGVQGATGPQGPIGLTGPAGPTGAQGSQGVQGVAGTNGTNGTNGQNTLVKTTVELAGANCTTGGVKIEYGLDANNNETLDVAEINISLTKYVCNGSVGTTGATGPQGPIGLTGAAGAQGPQGIQGVTGTNGTNGTNGLNALIKTTTEPTGTNCTNGGTKIETGLDANGNSVLDSSEVNASQTQYVCNGGSSNNSSIYGFDSTSLLWESGSAWWCCGPTYSVPQGKLWKIIRYTGSTSSFNSDENNTIWLNEGQNIVWKGNGSSGSNLPFNFMAFEYTKSMLNHNVYYFEGIGYWNNNPPGNQTSWTVPNGKIWHVKYVTGACQTNFGSGMKILDEGQVISFTGNGSNGGTLPFSFLVFEYDK
jgi:hypothetical protein